MASALPSVPRRAYDRLLIAAPLPVRRRAVYLAGQHRWPRLRAPRRWSEKLNWRILHDRRDLLAFTCDKQAMKDYARRVAAPRLVRVPATYWFGDDPEGLRGFDWPARWVMKPNHGTGHVLVGEGTPDLDEVVTLARRWLADRGPAAWGEWAYSQARRAVIVEEAIGPAGGFGLTDYKAWVFHGRPLMWQIDTGRFVGHRRRFYTADWRALPHRAGEPLGPVDPAPAALDRLLDAAAVIGAEFDFLRVDLYEVDGEVWFGELTPYSGSGVTRWEPDDLDTILGDAWTLPTRAELRAGRTGTRPTGPPELTRPPAAVPAS